MNPDIIEKIKKLLRLAQSSNQAEAALALRRAMELANKHKVDVTGLDLDAESEKIAHEWFHFGSRITGERRIAWQIVTNYFNVELCVSYPRVVFVGTATDIKIAEYVVAFLLGVMRRGLKEFATLERRARRKMSINKRDNWLAGFSWAMTAQLKKQAETPALEAEKFALVSADQEKRRQDYMDQIAPDREKVKRKDTTRRNPTAIVAGLIAGQNTSILTPLESSKQAPLLLL